MPTRQERRARRRERARTGEEERERGAPWFTLLVIAVVVVFAFFGARALGVFDRPAETAVAESPRATGGPTVAKGAAIGQRVQDMGNEHIQQGRSFTGYNSTPPTSGAHWPQPAAWRIYDQPVPDEQIVHNHEHGGVTISYNQISPTDLAALRALFDRYPRDRHGSKKIIIRPYDKIPPGTIALTSWNWKDEMQAYDERRILAFLDAHINECCEDVP